MSQVNRIPIGYLDLVGNETQGKNPFESLESLRPTVSMDQFYLGQTLGNVNATFTNSGIGVVSFTDVPSDELWILLSVSLTETQDAGQLTQFEVNIQRTPRQDNVALGGFAGIFVSRVMTVATTGDIAAEAFLLPQPMVLTPGTRIVYRILQWAGLSRTARKQMLFHRLNAG